jgi:glutamate dehydrogenase
MGERRARAKPSRHAAPGKPLLKTIAAGLLAGALPDEIDGFDAEDAARFIADAAQLRQPGNPAIRLESTGGRIGRRRMRLAVVNDDMPFLVDSVAGAVSARGLQIHRMLHPIFCAERTKGGALEALELPCDDLPSRESFLYLEIDRAASSDRRALLADLGYVLADVRAAVNDWPQLRERLRADAEQLEGEESRELLHWFADGAMTLLGFHVERPGSAPTEGLGILRDADMLP